jgi:hypothetical protein
MDSQPKIAIRPQQTMIYGGAKKNEAHDDA